MEKWKVRVSLFTGSVIVVLADILFLWVLNLSEPDVVKQNLKICSFILCTISIIALVIFFGKGPVFNIRGDIEKSNILAMLVSVLIVIQLAYSFAVYSQKNQIFKDEMYNDIKESIINIQEHEYEIKNNNFNEVLKQQVKDYIVKIDIIDKENVAVYSSDEKSLQNQVSTGKGFVFSYKDELRIHIVTNNKYIKSELMKILTNLLTVLVISIFFSVEIVLFMIKLTTERKIKGITNVEDKTEALSYVRQIAFLFYFASRLSASFIPNMAKGFGDTILGISKNGAAGIPQSGETLFTCAAIFITTELITRKGWKAPFSLGLFLVTVGTIFSAISPNLLMFVLARSVVGLGYGFCWMTLRNLALFGKDESQQVWGFSMLNAGLYAGMNCGSSMGAMLAETIGYRNVFFVAAVLTALCSVAIIRMENKKLPRKNKVNIDKLEEKVKNKFTITEKVYVISFALLMIAPSCIVGSYFSYFLPLYFEEIGRSVADVGRAQLLYGIIIVYIGPSISVFLMSKGNILLKANYIYNILLAIGVGLVGIFGGIIPALLAAMCIGIADSFGFGAQNSYFLALKPIMRLGASKSLSYLSFLKKIMEMLGPTVFAIVLILGFQKGSILLGGTFIIAAIVFTGIQFAVNKKEMEIEK